MTNPNMYSKSNTSIDPVKMRIITEIQEKSKHMSMEQMLPQIMQINQELKKRNISFTKEESEILLSSIEKNLSEDDRKKFNIIRSMMK